MDIDTRSRATRIAVGKLLAALAGIAGLIMGLLFMGMDLTSGAYDPAGLLAAGVAATGGAAMLILLARGPRALTWTIAAVVAVGGTAAGLFARTDQFCCMFAHSVGWGYPFPWITKSGVANDPGRAMTLAYAGRPRIDALALAGDLVFWGFAGLLVALLGTLAGRALRGRLTTRP